MAKLTLTDLANLQNDTTATTAINNNNTAIETAMENTLSRDGTSPNSMSANIDMDGNRVLNLAQAISPDEPVRVRDIEDLSDTGTITFNSLPTGGAKYTVLAKDSTADYDADWTASLQNITTLITGTSTSIGSVASIEPALQIHGTSFADSMAGIFTWRNDNSHYPFLEFNKSNSASVIGTHLVVSSADFLGEIDFNGSDGTAFRNAAAITGQVDNATPSSTSMPGRLSFWTCPSGSVSAVERVRIDNAGKMACLAPLGGLGYGTGSGGTIAQGTSRNTAVTLNTVTGQITLFSTVGSSTPVSFTVNNSAVSPSDTVIVNQKSGADKYQNYITSVSSGTFQITITTTGTSTEAPVLNFSIIKGSSA